MRIPLYLSLEDTEIILRALEEYYASFDTEQERFRIYKTIEKVEQQLQNMGVEIVRGEDE